MIRHIPTGTNTAIVGTDVFCRTYCGRVVPVARCINLQRDCIEDAECRACQRSDDRRTSEDHWDVIRAAATRNGHVLNSRNVCRICGENMADVLELDRCLGRRANVEL